MKIDWRIEIPQVLIVIGMFVAAALVWQSAPDSIPVHWNIRGEVDRYGGKFEGLLSIPILAVVLYALFLVLPRIDPGKANYPSFQHAYLVIRTAILGLLAVVYACILLVAFGSPIQIGTVVPITVGALFMVLGNVMGKIRPNWFVGIRTPWTLSSRRSWNKTHRLGGWLFVGMGLAIIACGFVQSVWMLVTTATVIVASVTWMTVYSYLVWRADPERLSATAISPASQ